MISVYISVSPEDAGRERAYVDRTVSGAAIMRVPVRGNAILIFDHPEDALSWLHQMLSGVEEVFHGKVLSAPAATS